jgi:flagellar motor switch protein FliN
MTETETIEQVEAPEITEAVAEMIPAQASATPASAETSPDEVKVMEIGPTLVEAAPPKKIDLPNTPEIRRILQVQVPLIVRLANKVMALGEITQLQPGTIIEFTKVIGEDLDLMINNKCIGGGQAVKVGEKFGIKVTNLETIDKMILAMGGK